MALFWLYSGSILALFWVYSGSTVWKIEFWLYHYFMLYSLFYGSVAFYWLFSGSIPKLILALLFTIFYVFWQIWLHFYVSGSILALPGSICRVALWSEIGAICILIWLIIYILLIIPWRVCIADWAVASPGGMPVYSGGLDRGTSRFLLQGVANAPNQGGGAY